MKKNWNVQYRSYIYAIKWFHKKYTDLVKYFSLKEEALPPQGCQSLMQVQVFPTKQTQHTHKRYRSVILLKIRRLQKLLYKTDTSSIFIITHTEYSIERKVVYSHIPCTPPGMNEQSSSQAFLTSKQSHVCTLRTYWDCRSVVSIRVVQPQCIQIKQAVYIRELVPSPNNQCQLMPPIITQ